MDSDLILVTFQLEVILNVSPGEMEKKSSFPSLHCYISETRMIIVNRSEAEELTERYLELFFKKGSELSTTTIVFTYLPNLMPLCVLLVF